MPTFDPFAWACRWVPEALLNRLIRGAAVVLFLGFAALRVSQYRTFALKPLWFAETAVFCILAAAYLLRRDPVDRARGAREILVPLLGALLPFALLFVAPSPWVVRSPALRRAVFWWMTGGTALTAWGLWALRRSFSITVEAREVVTRGPYRWVRHPVYLGELLTAAAVAFWRFAPANVALLLLFAAIQLLRCRWEEQKLDRALPGYGSYAARAWWFW